MNFKSEQRAFLKARGRLDYRQAGASARAPAPNTPAQEPEATQSIPAIRLRAGRNRYACATAGCPGRMSLSNGETATCTNCGRHHRLHNPYITHWTEPEPGADAESSIPVDIAIQLLRNRHPGSP